MGVPDRTDGFEESLGSVRSGWHIFNETEPELPLVLVSLHVEAPSLCTHNVSQDASEA